MAKYNQAIAEINEEENLIFEGEIDHPRSSLSLDLDISSRPLHITGVLYQRDAVAEVGANISSKLPGGEHRTQGTEGLVMRLRGDGKQFTCVLGTEQGHRYTARFPTKAGYLHVRVPWTSFRPESPDLSPPPPPLDPKNINYLGLRYEFKRSPLAAAAR